MEERVDSTVKEGSFQGGGEEEQREPLWEKQKEAWAGEWTQKLSRTVCSLCFTSSLASLK